MDKFNELLFEEGLSFFGHINASISHELKNILATVSETSGLISDLIEVAEETGRPLDIQAIKASSHEIAEEIQRGFQTIKQMNKFAHSVDNSFCEVALTDVLDLVINLSQYLSYSSDVEFFKNGSSDVTIFTCPFLLQDLIYQSLSFTYKLVGYKGVVRISLVNEEKESTIVLENMKLDEGKPFPEVRIQKIAEILGVTLGILPNRTGFFIKIPKTIKTMYSRG
jgi:signal transduction histidine kinase